MFELKKTSMMKKQKQHTKPRSTLNQLFVATV